MASGGMILSGDDISTLTPVNEERLKKMLPPTDVAAIFNESYEIGRAKLGEEREYIYLFNYGNEEKTMDVELTGDSRVTDFWTEESLIVKDNRISVTLSPRSIDVPLGDGAAGHGICWMAPIRRQEAI